MTTIAPTVIGTSGSRTLRSNSLVLSIPLVLRRGLRNSWLKAQLGLWKALADTAKKWARRWPPAASPQELEVWRKGLLLDLTESAFYIALDFCQSESKRLA
jgi:hypothetical protein